MTPTGFRLGEFVVEPATDRLLHVDTGTRTDLEPKTMEVLVVLADHTGEVVSSATLINCVWHGRPMGDNPVYKAVAKLRRALHDDAAAPRYIETIPRKGYRLLVAPSPVAVHDPRPRPAQPPCAPAPAAEAATAGRLHAALQSAARPFAAHRGRTVLTIALLIATLALVLLRHPPLPASVARPVHPDVAPARTHTAVPAERDAVRVPYSHSFINSFAKSLSGLMLSS
jgi:DNA-binding winged helix-turn-helix (wHTH) protein